MLLLAGGPAQREESTRNPEKRLAPSKKNATAEELESLALAFGLDEHRGDSSAEHPSREDIDAYQRSDIGPWLDAQLKIADDSIAPAPASVRTFLEKRQPTLWRVVGLLERDVPLWESDPRAKPRDLSGPGLASRLARILAAAALVEERAGRHVQAGDCLEASWSLFRSFSGQPDQLSQLIAVALGKLQAGALRKMSEPPVQWFDRMSGVEPWLGMLDSMDAERDYSTKDGDAKLFEIMKKFARASRVVTDRLREASPCEVSKLTTEEIWKPAQDVLDQEQEADGDPSPGIFLSIATPNLTAAIRRAGRLVVDRELTAKILELRQEKTASQDGRWPAKFLDGDSRVCPGSSYEYQTKGAAMAIRFNGPIDDGGSSSLVLPTSFEVRAPRPTPTPAKPRSSVTPRPRS